MIFVTNWNNLIYRYYGLYFLKTLLYYNQILNIEVRFKRMTIEILLVNIQFDSKIWPFLIQFHSHSLECELNCYEWKLSIQWMRMTWYEWTFSFIEWEWLDMNEFFSFIECEWLVVNENFPFIESSELNFFIHWIVWIGLFHSLNRLNGSIPFINFFCYYVYITLK